MIIKNLRVEEKKDSFKILVEVESETLKKELWFSVPLEYKEYICTTQYDGFLVGLLYPAMVAGEDIKIEGKVSSKLLFNINNYVIPLLCSFSPKAQNIKVISTEKSYEDFNGNGVGTGFSGGVDSFSTIYDHYELEKDPVYKINSFLFLNVGSHGCGEEEVVYSKFMKRYNYLKKFPEELGLAFIPLNSNLYEFHPWGHQLTCSLTLTSGILMLQKKYNKYYCSSLGWSYLEILEYYKDDLGKDIAIFDPILLPLLSTESLELIADGTQYTRVEKVKNIVNYEPVYRYLNVCVSGEDTHENCSICSKCCRTLMALDSIGKIEEFTKLFNIEKYRKKAQKKYVALQVLEKEKNAFARDNVELAKLNNKKLPTKVESFFICLPDLLKRYISKNLSTETKKKIKRIINKK